MGDTGSEPATPTDRDPKTRPTDGAAGSAFAGGAGRTGRDLFSDEPAVGDLFAERYELRDELGRGGQGAVFSAWDVRLKRAVAVKILRDGAGASGAALGRFRREAEIAMRLDHPGICPVFDVGRHEGSAFIVMRLVDGQTLADRILALRPESSASRNPTAASAKPIAVDEADSEPPSEAPKVDRATVIDFIRIIESVARTLHVAHEAGIVHRDIKPGNIMIPKDGEPVILDFGLARDQTETGAALTLSGDILGTPAYMSPEQLLDPSAKLDRRTDVYSLGVTLFECITLRKPFRAPTRDGLYREILEEPPPNIRRLNPQTPRDLKTVLEVALEKNRNARYQTALDFAADLRRVCENEPIHARPIGTTRLLRRWARRHPRIATGTIVLFVSMAVALVVAFQLLSATEAERSDKARVVVELTQLADVKRIRDLRAEATRLWPPYPQHVPAMQAWIAKAEALEAKLPLHRSALDAVRARVASASVGVDHERDALQWQCECVTEIVTQLERFVAPEPEKGDLAEMRSRLSFAETVERRTLIDAGEAWDEAIRSIASVTDCPAYKGLRIQPQLGLIPTGRNRNSGLWEFAILQTGTVPSIGADGEPVLRPDSAVLLVLLPGGEMLLGSPDTEDGRGDDEPIHAGSFPPFFAGKYELSQAAWSRVMRGLPPSTKRWVEPYDPMLPVSDIAWDDAAEFCTRVGCQLPTEDQWEYVCRSHARTAYWFGDDPSGLQRYGNIGDQLHALTLKGSNQALTFAPWQDGFSAASPIDAFPPNRFAIFGVNGNVSEWCAGSEADDPAVRLAETMPSTLLPRRAYRDGNWLLPPVHARCAARREFPLGVHSPILGMRVVRGLSDG